MIQLFLTGVNFGIERIQNQNPETGEIVQGCQINLVDPKSGMIVHVPFSGSSVKDLVAQISETLTAEQRRELAPLFNGGIILPDSSTTPPIQRPDLPEGWKEGPQG